MVLPCATEAVLILPCSAEKARGGGTETGQTVLELLGHALADQLVNARRSISVQAQVDERQLLPAWRRYRGTFYGAAGNRLSGVVAASVPTLILSGGYGLVLGEEPIGYYDRRFLLHDWPRDLIEKCLIAAVRSLGASAVVAFCAQTTAYAKVVRRASWSKDGIRAYLVSPDMGGRGGAQVFEPRALGQAIIAFLDGQLNENWNSTVGVSAKLESIAR